MLYYVTQDNVQELYEREASWQIKRLFSGEQNNGEYTVGNWLDYSLIYIDIWDDEDETVRRSFMEILEYLCWGEAQLSGITALTRQPEQNTFYCMSDHSWLFNVGIYLFKVWSKNLVDGNYYRKIYHDISVPCIELALLELFQEENFREIGANRLVELMAEHLDKIDLEVIRQIELNNSSYGKGEPYKTFMHLYNALTGKVDGAGSFVYDNKYLQLYHKGYRIDNQSLEKFQKLHDVLLNFEFTMGGYLYDTDEILNVAFWDSFYSNRIAGSNISLKRAQDLKSASEVWSSSNLECFFGVEDNNPLIRDGVWSKARWLCRNQDEKDFINAFAYMALGYNFYSRIWYLWTIDEIFSDVLYGTGFIAVIRSLDKILNGEGDITRGFRDEQFSTASKNFVSPEKLEGTLRMAHCLARDLSLPLKALFFHAVILELHPFRFGNGRIARCLMNTLLLAEWCYPILVTSKWVDSYFKAVKDFSISGDVYGYCQGMKDLLILIEEHLNPWKKWDSLDEVLMSYEEWPNQHRDEYLSLGLD